MSDSGGVGVNRPVYTFANNSDTIKYVSDPLDLAEKLRSEFPAQLGKDGALTILDNNEIESLLLSLEVKWLIKFAMTPFRKIIHSANNILTEMHKLSDATLVRLNKSKYGKTLYMSLSNVYEYRQFQQNSENGKRRVLLRW